MAPVARPCSPRSGQAGGFSLVEVVLALGIFSFAIVVIIALFGGVSKNTRSLVDRDAAIAAWQSLEAAIADMPSSTVFGVPTGTNDSGRPERFARVIRPGSMTNAMGVEIESAATGFTNTPADGRLYRVRLYRALAGTNEAAWLPDQAYYPLRVQVDTFVADAYASTNRPMETTTLHIIWNAH